MTRVSLYLPSNHQRHLHFLIQLMPPCSPSRFHFACFKWVWFGLDVASRPIYWNMNRPINPAGFCFSLQNGPRPSESNWDVIILYWVGVTPNYYEIVTLYISRSFNAGISNGPTHLTQKIRLCVSGNNGPNLASHVF